MSPVLDWPGNLVEISVLELECLGFDPQLPLRQDNKIVILVAASHSVWYYGVSIRAGLPGVTML